MEVVDIKSFNEVLKIDDLKFEKSNRKSSFFYVEKKEINLKKHYGQSEIDKFLDRILIQALINNCSDIHLEPFSRIFKIRYRIDGVLVKIKSIEIGYYPQVVSRIKILCGLDITERRTPQDGRFQIKFEENDYDLRIGIIPTYHGEKIVIRILDKNNINGSLEALGFNKKYYKKLFEMIKRKSGMIIFTGPMGSGKTTSMYSILNELNDDSVNITTIEDPIEYSIEGINQIQCQNEIGLTFSVILKGILRQDSDIIMIGEIRDKETAEIALRASLTGHLVITTLHTNSSCSSIKRLIDLGIEPYVISAGVKGIQNQRLVRKLCQKCKIIDKEYLEKLKILGLDSNKYKDKIFYTHSGCEECHGTGYQGRTMIGEFLHISDDVIKTIENGASVRKIEESAKRNGMITILENGIYNALIGITSLDELIRQC